MALRRPGGIGCTGSLDRPSPLRPVKAHRLPSRTASGWIDIRHRSPAVHGMAIFPTRGLPAIQCAHGTRHLQTQAHAAVRAAARGGHRRPDRASPAWRRVPPARSSSREPGDLVVLLEGGLAMTSHDERASTSLHFSVDDDAPDPAILYTIPAARACTSEPALGLRAHRRSAARRRAVRQAGGQEHRRRSTRACASASPA